MKKKFLSILLVLSLMLALVPTAFAADEVWSSGTCGKEGDGSNITWTLYKSGLLTFTGTGAMRNYKSPVEDGTPSPWVEHSGIRRIEIGEGITSVGNNAFHASEGIESVTLPSTLRSIGKSAFSANGISEISAGVTINCTSLERVTFPDGGQVSDWAHDALADAVALGLISGVKTKDDAFLRPQGGATREQVATILMEFYTSIDNALIDVTTA